MEARREKKGGKMKEFEIPITRSAPKQAVKNPKVIDRMRRIAKKGPREFFGRKREKKERKKEIKKERKKEREEKKVAGGAATANCRAPPVYNDGALRS
ncbi:hypothetical protein HZU67_05799 [Apis mellifera carnica]|nr:hypothetical protein HZU67_05799 [Apis mellifera carnica]